VAEAHPSVTVLIAARPDQQAIRAVEASKALDYPKDRIEILVARGKQPSVQRNTGLREAKGELVYFLDDDSEPMPQNLIRAAAHFADPAVQIVGGPNLCPEGAPALEHVFSVVLASGLAFGPSRARYCRVGQVRPTGEKELILCNLVARRSTLLSLGGFDESLYPNEENALMDQLQKQGHKLLYDPEFYVFRRPRPTLKAFARMLLTYGRGRAEQFRTTPTAGSILNFVPPLFVVYLPMVMLYLISLVFWWPTLTGIWKWVPLLPILPLLLYCLALCWEGVALSCRHGVARALAALPLVCMTHLLYGFGFWRGLFTRLHIPKMGSVPVVLEKRPAV
jgi:glycosyltransferase involved in cell wall biosynthesis